MNRSELVAAVAEHTGHTQTAVNGVVDAIFTVVSGEVAKGNKVTIPGWVSFDRTTAQLVRAATPRPVPRFRSQHLRVSRFLPVPS